MGKLKNSFEFSEIDIPEPDELTLQLVEDESNEAEETIDETGFEPEQVTDAFRLYLKDVGSKPLLSKEEERELAFRKVQGDKEAKRILIECNLRLVINIAKKYYYKEFGTQLLDYIQNGNMGLIRAVEKYDPTKNVKLSTYATYWIRQTVIRETMKQTGVITLPTQISENVTKVNKALREYAINHANEPTIAELAKMAKLSVEDVKEVWKAKQGTVALDASIHQDENDPEGTFGSKIADTEDKDPFEQVAKLQLAEKLGFIEEKLTLKEYDIVRKRFGINGEKEHTLQEIAEQYELTRERIRQIIKESLVKLRDIKEIGDLADYLN